MVSVHTLAEGPRLTSSSSLIPSLHLLNCSSSPVTPTNPDDPTKHLIDGSVPPNALTTAWYSARTSPSEIHVELRKAGFIPDPYIGFNEHQVQWIGDAEWVYKCEFGVGDADVGRRGILEFAGLDAIADVYLVRPVSFKPMSCGTDCMRAILSERHPYLVLRQPV